MHFKITFDHPDGRYEAGEMLNGTVEIGTHENKRVRCIYIVVYGFAHVEWTERESYNRNSETRYRTVTYSSHEQYLDSKTVLFGTSGGETIELPSGLHTYTFSCYLPDRLPASYTHQYGKIEYSVRLTVDIPWALDKTHRQEFFVNNVMNLNLDPSLRVPIQLSEIESFWMCNCKANEVKFDLVLPKGGYMPGEKVTFSCSLKNESPVVLLGARYSLIRIVSFIVTQPMQKEKSITNAVLDKRIPLDGETRNTTTQFSGSFVVPQCPPTCTYSFNIRTKYIFRLEVEVSACHGNLVQKVPIDIGTIPLSDALDMLMPTAPALQDMGDFSRCQAPRPPTYEQVMKEKEFPPVAERVIGFVLPQD